jgi:hypothetical protein
MLNDFRHNLELCEKKASKLMREIPAIETGCKDKLEEFQYSLDKVKFQVNLRIDQLVEENFKIPDILVDEDDFKPTSFRDFMTGNLVSLANQIKKLDARVGEEFVQVAAFQEFQEAQVPRINSLYGQLEKIVEENTRLEVAILEVNNNLKISVHPVLVELRKDIIIMNEGVEDKLKKERAHLD